MKDLFKICSTDAPTPEDKESYCKKAFPDTEEGASDCKKNFCITCCMKETGNFGP